MSAAEHYEGVAAHRDWLYRVGNLRAVHPHEVEYAQYQAAERHVPGTLVRFLVVEGRPAELLEAAEEPGPVGFEHSGDVEFRYSVAQHPARPAVEIRRHELLDGVPAPSALLVFNGQFGAVGHLEFLLYAAEGGDQPDAVKFVEHRCRVRVGGDHEVSQAYVAGEVVGTVDRYGHRKFAVAGDPVEVLPFGGVLVEARHAQGQPAVQPDVPRPDGSVLRCLQAVVHEVALVGVEKRVLVRVPGSLSVEAEMVDQREAGDLELRLLGEAVAVDGAVALGGVVDAPHHLLEFRLFDRCAEAAVETVQELLEFAGGKVRPSAGELRKQAQIQVLCPGGVRGERGLVVFYRHPACGVAGEEAYPGDLVHALVARGNEGVLGLEVQASDILSAPGKRVGQQPGAPVEQFVAQAGAPAAGFQRYVDELCRTAVGIPVEYLAAADFSAVACEHREGLRICVLARPDALQYVGEGFAFAVVGEGGDVDLLLEEGEAGKGDVVEGAAVDELEFQPVLHFGLCGFLMLVGVLEHYHEEYGHDEGVGCEDVPGGAPVGSRGVVDEVVDHYAGRPCAYRGPESVGHEHEQSLCGGAHLLVDVLVDEERAGDVEEIEGHAVDYAAEHEEPYAAAGVAEAEEGEAEHPCEHRYEHHALDAEPLHEEGDQKDAECLGYLAQGDQSVGVVGSPCVGVVGVVDE